jgi:hypothetical protein
MDFTKYVDLIARGSLFLCRADRLGDPFEGSFTRWNIEVRRALYKDVPEDLLPSVSDFAKVLRNWTYVNCWHLNRHESMAMWKLYSKSQESIAIRTTYKRLLSVLPQEVILGPVGYVDHEKELVPDGDCLSQFFCKRKSFVYEQEVRAAIQEFPRSKDVFKQNPEVGKSIPIDVEELIETVYVGPTSASWYFDLVQEVTRKYCISCPVIRSSMDDPALF